MARSLPVFAAALLAVGHLRAQPPQRVAVLVAASDMTKRIALQKLSKTIQPGATMSVHELDEESATNPIAKGKLIAELQLRQLVVAVGDETTEFATRELEDTPIYFIGAGLLRGDSLASSLVTGTFSYSVDGLLDAAKALWPGKLGLAYTPGYEPVAQWVRKGAAERGLALTEKKIANYREFMPAMRDLLEHSDAIWVVGDPLLVRGAGFEFLRERALSRRLPIIANGSWEVRHGALLAFEPKVDSLLTQAADALAPLLRGERSRSAALRPAPRGGTLLLNGTLAEKWKITPPEGMPWRLVQ